MKKIRLLVVPLLSLALVACGGKGNDSSSKSGALTRSDAVAILNKIAENTVAQTKGVIDDGAGKVVNIGENFISTVYSQETSVKVSSDSVTVTAGAKLAAWYDGSTYNYYFAEDDTKNIYTTTSDTLFASITAKIKTYAGYATYSSAFAKYLGNFNDDGSAVATGGTAKGATIVKQAYSSTGDGNLGLDITVHYSYDERLLYGWKDNLCTTYKGSSCTWGVSSTSYPTDGNVTFDDKTGPNLVNTIVGLL